MAAGNDGQKTPTVDDIMKVLDRVGERLDRVGERLDRVGERLNRMAAERDADNTVARERQAAADQRQAAADQRQAAADQRQKEDNEAAKQRQKEDNEAARQRQAAADQRQAAADQRRAAIDKQAQATEKQVQETSKELKAVGRYVRELGKQIGDVGNQWGSIAEYLIASDFARILQERFDITIDHSAPSLKGSYQGKEWEVDAFAANGEIALVGEVKLTLTIEAVDKFVNNNLRNFHRYMPLYRDRKIYGLMAFVKIDRGKEREITEYVHSLGLLLVKAIDNTFRLLSPQGHRLHDYGLPKS